MAARKERMVLQADSTKIEGYEQAGTLEGWRDQIAMPCAGNSRLVLGISAAFAAPLLYHLEQGNFTIHARGVSSIGKSTLLRVGKSVVGDPASIRTWRATASGLESVAAIHNDNLLCLDEMGEADPKEIGATAYMLGNGQGKLRQTRNISLRPSLRWRLVCLSTGEVSLSDLLVQAKQRMKAGQAVRVVDLPADPGKGLGLFDRLPEGFSTGAAFADYLKEAGKQQHGIAFVEYLKRLVKDLPTHIRTVKDYREQWRHAYLPGNAEPQVGRVADSFATLAAVGELATDFGITGWRDGEAGEAVAVCFDAWLAARGGLGNQEEADILAYVRNHFEADGSAKYAYINLRQQDDKVMYRMGYRDEQGDYFVLPSRFEAELCRAAGFDKQQVIDVLIKHRFLLPGNDGRPTISKRVYSLDTENPTVEKKPVRVYHIDSSVVGGAG